MSKTYEFTVPESTARKPFHQHWQFCVGSGQAKLALRSDYARQLAYVHRELGIERVRFHGIFDDSMQAYMGMDDFLKLPGSKRYKNYNFHNIGVAYDAVLAAGMKPWVELSFMPSRLAKKDKKVTVNAEGRATMPKNDAEWTEFIQAFIRFLLHRYGKEEVETWYFEVWNEPNMFAFFKGSKEDYFHLYEITSRAVRAVDGSLKVGGPSTANGAWLAEFIDFCESRHLPLDFITTHFYPGEGIGDVFLGKIMADIIVGGAMRLRKNGGGRALEGCQIIMTDKTEEGEERPRGQMYDFSQKVHEEVAGRYPVFLTEWNFCSIVMAPSNDDKKVAAFQMKSIDEMEPFMDGTAIWCFSDIFDEFIMIPDQFSGSFGLLTIDGIPKPQFHMLKLLAGAEPLKYDLPRTNDEVEITVFDAEDGLHKQVSVYRSRMKNTAEPAAPYQIRLELPEGMPGETVRVTRYRIDQDHCNPKRVWQEMGSPMEMNRQEIEEIITRSALQAEPVEVLRDGQYLVLSGELEVNDVHFYEIR